MRVDDVQHGMRMRPRPTRARRAALVGIAFFGAAIALAPAASPGPIEEQRRRLPPAPPADACSDPIEGVWRSQTFYPRQGQWYVFTLTIDRLAESKLSGDIEVEGWNGLRAKAEKPKCFWTVSEPAEGTIDGVKLDFHGTSFTQHPPTCGPPPGGYVVDTFLGTLEPSIQEFQSVNRYPMNGSTKLVEDVTVFRRISCFGADAGAPGASAAPIPPAATPPPAASAPTIEPKARPAFGCNCGK